MDEISKLFDYSGDDKFVILTSDESVERLEKFSESRKGKAIKLKGFYRLLDKSNGYEFQEPLSDIQIEEIMKTEFVRKTLRTYPNTIFILNLNYGFNDRTNAKVLEKDGIIINAKNYPQSSSVETFVHELGHLFHYSLRKDRDYKYALLEEILLSNEVKSDSLLQEYWRRVAKMAGKDLFREQYADIFMIAYLNSSKVVYEKYQLFTLIEQQTKDYIGKQFENIILIQEKENYILNAFDKWKKNRY